MHRLRIVLPRKGDDVRVGDGHRPNIDHLPRMEVLEILNYVCCAASHPLSVRRAALRLITLRFSGTPQTRPGRARRACDRAVCLADFDAATMNASNARMALKRR